jgi:hypothetical protein
MQFTNEDRRMIESLRRQHENWRAVRLIIFVGSLSCAASAVAEILSNGLGTLTLLLTVIAAAGASYSLGGWAGRPEIGLLLKLIEEAERSRDAA